MEPTTELLPGAEPFAHDAGPLGVLVCHGFTGSPQSMRPWAEFLADHDLTVRLPVLPGHGTRWQDMNRTGWRDWYGALEPVLTELAGRCERVFVVGLSMGGTLALRLAEQHPEQVAGLVLVNASLHTENRQARLLPVLRFVVPSMPGIGSDIKKPGARELAYDRLPVKAMHSLTQLWALTRADLGRITAPVLLYRSAVDHVVEASNAAYLLSHLPAGQVEERVLPESYHVATLDNDAETIFSGSLEFIRRHAPAATA